MRRVQDNQNEEATNDGAQIEESVSHDDIFKDRDDGERKKRLPMNTSLTRTVGEKIVDE